MKKIKISLASDINARVVEMQRKQHEASNAKIAKIAPVSQMVAAKAAASTARRPPAKTYRKAF